MSVESKNQYSFGIFAHKPQKGSGITEEYIHQILKKLGSYEQKLEQTLNLSTVDPQVNEAKSAALSILKQCSAQIGEQIHPNLRAGPSGP